MFASTTICPLKILSSSVTATARTTTPSPASLLTLPAGFASGNNVNHPRAIAAGYTRIFTSNLVNEYHFGYNRPQYAYINPQDGGVNNAGIDNRADVVKFSHAPRGFVGGTTVANRLTYFTGTFAPPPTISVGGNTVYTRAGNVARNPQPHSQPRGTASYLCSAAFFRDNAK